MNHRRHIPGTNCRNARPGNGPPPIRGMTGRSRSEMTCFTAFLQLSPRCTTGWWYAPGRVSEHLMQHTIPREIGMLPGGLRQPVPHHRHRLTETCLRRKLRRAGRILGLAVAGRSQPVRPSVISVCGQLAGTEENLLAGIREIVYQRRYPWRPSSSNRAQPTRFSRGGFSDSRYSCRKKSSPSSGSACSWKARKRPQVHRVRGSDRRFGKALGWSTCD